MLQRHLLSKKSALHRHLSHLKVALNKNDIQPNKKSPSPFIFLCGANKQNGGLSERRVALERFLTREVPESRSIVAERFIEFLEKSKKKQNLYDIEQTISGFADVIVIVLESYSAFTELGAFATKDLRQKLFVINDEEFRGQSSFINLGPISAVSEVDQDAVGWYKMDPFGVENGDGIGDIFSALKKSVLSRLPKNESLDNLKLKPAGPINRWAFSFCHDLIFLSRKVTTKELVLIYEFLFGKGDFDSLSTYNALLTSLGLAKKNGEYLQSTQNAPLLSIPINKIALQSSFVAARYHSRAANG